MASDTPVNCRASLAELQYTRSQTRKRRGGETPMRSFLGILILSSGLSAQTTNTSSDLQRTVVSRLQLEQYKAHIKGLSQFGDRMQGTPRNRDAIDWLEKQLKAFGYSNVQRHRFMSASGPLENI